jgi:putative endonuclease
MQKETKRQIGDKGEVIAIRYLQEKWYKIITTNYSIHGGEIDIIASYEWLVVFVEVRKRKSDHFAHPLDTFTRTKRQSLRRAIMMYANKQKVDFEKIRVDFIAIMDRENWIQWHRVWHVRGVEL